MVAVKIKTYGIRFLIGFLLAVTLFGCGNEKVQQEEEQLFSTTFSMLHDDYLSKDSLIQIGGLFPQICPPKKRITLKLQESDFVCENAKVVANIEELENSAVVKDANFDLIVYVDKNTTKNLSKNVENIVSLAKKSGATLFIVSRDDNAEKLFKSIKKQMEKDDKKEIVNISLSPLNIEKSRRNEWEHLYAVFR